MWMSGQGVGVHFCDSEAFLLFCVCPHLPYLLLIIVIGVPVLCFMPRLVIAERVHSRPSLCSIGLKNNIWHIPRNFGKSGMGQEKACSKF